MVIVHVAIVSGCLLASNNPSTAAGIVGGHHGAMSPSQLIRTNTLTGTPEQHGSAVKNSWTERVLKAWGWNNAYETQFQPVTLWSRGMNKRRWIRRFAAQDGGPDAISSETIRIFEDRMRISPLGWLWKIVAPAVFLIIVPAVVGGIVTYETPPRGFACRSVSFVMYACAQLLLILLAALQNALDDGKECSWQWRTPASSNDPRPQWLYNKAKFLFTGRSFMWLSAPLWFASMLAAIGGTTMQITGVYRNCFCYAGSENWRGIIAVNAATFNDTLIQVATDTEDQRHSAHY
jgi:hypothetical protein